MGTLENYNVSAANKPNWTRKAQSLWITSLKNKDGLTDRAGLKDLIAQLMKLVFSSKGTQSGPTALENGSAINHTDTQCQQGIKAGDVTRRRLAHNTPDTDSPSGRILRRRRLKRENRPIHGLMNRTASSCCVF